MKIDSDTMKMKAKLKAFFDAATPEDISALLRRTNYEFYKNVTVPDEGWFEYAFPSMEEQVCTVEIPVMTSSHHWVPNRPIIYIGRGYPTYRLTPAADDEGLALAA